MKAHDSMNTALRKDFEFNAPNDSSCLYLRPFDLDIKQLEFVRTLLVNNTHIKITDVDLSEDQYNVIPVFAITSNKNIEEFYGKIKPRLSIFVDFHDTGYDFIGLSISLCQIIYTNNLNVIYIKLQIHDVANYYALNILPNHIHILSCPMLLGGSRYHITSQIDNEGDSLFRKKIQINDNPRYLHSWSWIGACTSKNREELFVILEKMADNTQLLRPFFKITQPNHSDAQLATIPHPQYLEICRSSYLCISLNGNGPWCLKDGELFSNHCCVLRQQHQSLDINPLSPRHAVDWIIFTIDNVEEIINYYINNSYEREMIRNTGFEYFKRILFNNYYSNEYAPRILRFSQSLVKSFLSPLVIS